MAHESLFHYERCGRLLRLDIRLSPLEMKEILVGMFARMGDDDRVDLMHAMLLLHTEPEEFLSTRASAVARAMLGDQTINIDTIAPMFRAELPGVR